MRDASHSSAKRRTLPGGNRRGVATLWVVLALPALIVLLCVVVEVGNLWRARVELQNAMDAAALAAVQEWQSGGNSVAVRHAAREVGVAFALANAVSGQLVNISENELIGADNDNALTTGNIVLGAVAQVGSELQFNASVAPGGGNAFGVRTQATVSLARICPSLGGANFTVKAEAVARAAASGPDTNPQLVRIDRYLP